MTMPPTSQTRAMSPALGIAESRRPKSAQGEPGMDTQRDMDILNREPELIARPLIVVAIILTLAACALYAMPVVS
jgi:hypothetical protein